MNPTKKFLMVLIPVLFMTQFAANAENLPDAETDGMDAVKSWSWGRAEQAKSEFDRSGGRRQPSPGFWGDQIVYQIQIDRFNDGDSSNNQLNIEEAQKNGDLKAIFDFRHGGDLKGIEQRLDYLKDLGITVLWLTPFLKHNGSYHGYCTTDPTQVDPGFGSNEDFRRLVAEAHRRGMYVVMDVVVNHLCDPATFYSRHADHYRCANELDQKNWNGQGGGSGGQGELKFSSQFFKPLKSQYFFNRCGTNSTSDMQGTGPAAVYGDFVNGMFDFDTRDNNFQEIFTNLYKYWIAYADVDGFRLDAAKHVTEDYVAYFSTQTRDYARSVGKNNFFVIGEVAGPSDWIGRRLGKMFSNPQNPNDHGNVPATLTGRMWKLKPVYEGNGAAPYPGLTAVYDFAHGGTAVDVLHGYRPPSALEGQFKSTYFNDLAAQNDYRLNWNLLEIHDWPRFASRNKKAMEKSFLGAAYLAFAEGAPIFYYGFEQGFNGDCHWDSMNLGGATDAVRRQCQGGGDALYRQDMFLGGMTRLGSTVPEIDRLAYIGPAQSSTLNFDPYTNRDHYLFKSARKFIQVRRSCAALKYGSTTFRWVEMNSNEGILAFSRVDRAFGVHEALVVINTSWGERSLPDMMVESGNNRTWKNLFNGFEQGRVWDSWIHFSGMKIAPNSVMVFVPEENAGDYDTYLGAHRCRE